MAKNPVYLAKGGGKGEEKRLEREEEGRFLPDVAGHDEARSDGTLPTLK